MYSIRILRTVGELFGRTLIFVRFERVNFVALLIGRS